jgi:ferredoxin/flavodoxin---NADP+ reductase
MNEWVKGRVVGKRQWNPRLFSLRIDAPVEDFKAGQFTKVALEIGEQRVGRPYSLVNAPHERPLEIYFNEVPEGPLTPRLCDLSPGDGLWLTAKAGGIFTLENVAQRPHLWLLATGTALGVYLSILKTAEPWERFERVVLVHGVRTSDELSYAETIERLRELHADRFTFLPALSRERRTDLLHGRVTTLMETGALEESARLPIRAEDSHLMLCGNSAMIKDVRLLLEARGLRRHRRQEPGHYTTEQYH